MLIRPDMFVVYCIMHIVICVVHYNSSLDVFLSWIQMVLTMLSHSDTLPRASIRNSEYIVDLSLKRHLAAAFKLVLKLVKPYLPCNWKST